MKKPDNWETTEGKQFGTFNVLPAGGYICRILSAKESKSKKSQEDMLVIELDIAHGEYKDYFKNLSEKIKKHIYPVFRRVTSGSSLPFFKGDIESIEKSNNGYKFNFDEKTLIGKYVGCVFGNEEYPKDGDMKIVSKPSILCTVETIKNGKFKIPELKKFKPSTNYSDDDYRHSDEDFSPNKMNEDLPF